MRSSAAAVLLLAGITSLACRKPEYFPLEQGRKWQFSATEYEVDVTDTSAFATRTYAFEVTGSAIEPGLGKAYAVRLTRDEGPYLSFFFHRTPEAVFVLPASHLDGLEPTAGWVRMLELPLRPGAFWQGDADGSASFEVITHEAIATPAGTFRDCFRIRIHAPQPYLMDVWLAPGAGIVRWLRRFSSIRFEVSEIVRL